jgi:signal transduction histidine kinase
MAVLISVFHYFTPTALHHFHDILQRLYYLCVIPAAYFFGIKIGLAYALLCGLLYAPHIFFQWAFSPHHTFTQYVEISMFFVIATLVGFLSEVQKRQRLELMEKQQGLHRAERLNLLGKLAAGLAHEVRNPLGGLLGSAEILRKEIGQDDPKIEFVDIIEKELKRLNNKLNEFLSFARSKPLEIIPNNINDIIEATLTILDSQFKKCNISVSRQLSAEQVLVPVDSEQLKQVLLNLMLNSIESMGNAGTLEIRTQHEKAWLSISLKDNGHGISNENLSRIFDPFFTTKPEGTGLGLSIAKQIVENHKGSLEVQSRTEGSQFIIRIPHG